MVLSQRQGYIYHLPATDVRVGEAFTKDRKSSAAFSDGLEDMVLGAHDRISGEGMVIQVRVGLGCSSNARKCCGFSMG